MHYTLFLQQLKHTDEYEQWQLRSKQISVHELAHEMLSHYLKMIDCHRSTELLNCVVRSSLYGLNWVMLSNLIKDDI